MEFFNLALPEQRVDFASAVRLGLGQNQGLFFPAEIPVLDADVLALDFVSRSTEILYPFMAGCISKSELHALLADAFDFPLPLQGVADGVHALELFHGPSLAFKDFGARFLARCLHRFSDDGPMTILTATSGDTGAAVAHAFYGLPGVRVVVLYPKGRISDLQEKLFCTLGGNIETLAVASDFDACQALVKQAFDDQPLRQSLALNSANSINIARLLAQVCYYFEAGARLQGEPFVASVPSGNFGNVTAALIARTMGAPISRVVATTNSNDTVPRYLVSGDWSPKATISTITNAMDISEPNNFPRVAYLSQHYGQQLGEVVQSLSIDEQQTREAVVALDKQGYLADPHTALAYAGLIANKAADEQGVFLCTAHPAKFNETLEAVLDRPIALPPALAAVQDKQVLSKTIRPDFEELKRQLG